MLKGEASDRDQNLKESLTGAMSDCDSETVYETVRQFCEQLGGTSATHLDLRIDDLCLDDEHINACICDYYDAMYRITDVRPDKYILTNTVRWPRAEWRSSLEALFTYDGFSYSDGDMTGDGFESPKVLYIARAGDEILCICNSVVKLIDADYVHEDLGLLRRITVRPVPDTIKAGLAELFF